LLSGCREYVPGPPPTGIDVYHYEAVLKELDGSWSARVRLDLKMEDGPGLFELDYTGPAVDSVHVDGAVAAFDQTRWKLGISMPETGAGSIEVFYRGTPAGVITRTLEGQYFTFTESWPYHNRGWLPGIHHPSASATFGLTLTIPEQPAVASGELMAVDTLDGRLRYRWLLGAPAPPHSFAFAFGPFAEGESYSRAMVPENVPLADLSDLLGRAEEFLESRFGPSPYGPVRVVSIPIRYDGLELAGMIAIHPDRLRDARLGRLLAHELAHQWFGIRAALASWEDLWLSESMATYLAARFEASSEMDMAAIVAGWQRAGGPPPVPRSARSPGRLLGSRVYASGALVLHDLHDLVGDSAFEAALTCILRIGQERPVGTEDFRGCLEAVSGMNLEMWFRTRVYE
jgi:aminopeptidase N